MFGMIIAGIIVVILIYYAIKRTKDKAKEK